MRFADQTHRTAALTFVALAIAFLVPAAIQATEAGKTTDEGIVYAALRPHGWDLVLLPADGSPPRRLTDHPALDYNPTVSPDGRWLVFVSERAGNPDLFILDLENSTAPPRQLTDHPALQDAPSFSPDGRRLAFVATNTGHPDIYLADFDPETGALADDYTNLTNDDAGDFNPAFSPLGKTIAFASDRDGYKASEIYIVGVDGNHRTRVTDEPGWDGSPAFAPKPDPYVYYYAERDGVARLRREHNIFVQGTYHDTPFDPAIPARQSCLSPTVLASGRIAFTTKVDGHWRIASVDQNGADYKLHDQPDDSDLFAPSALPGSDDIVAHGILPVSADEAPPSFRGHTAGPFAIAPSYTVTLPDRELQVATIRGVFPAYSTARRELASGESFDRIVRSNFDGTDVSPIFQPDAGNVWRPSWSPDGSWLVATVGPTFADPDASNDIWRFNADGSDPENLTNSPTANDAFPYVSHDGRHIVFRSGRDGNHEIYLMNVDDKKLTRLTENDAVDTMPAIDPSGRRIAFTSTRDGNYEIYLLHLDDRMKPGKLRRVTDHPGRDTHPKFSPDGRWLVFASERGGIVDESPLIPIFNPQPYGDVYAIHLDDDTIVRITDNKWEDGTPTWAQLSPGDSLR